MFKKIKSMTGQKGFTLVELLVSIALSGIIGVAIVAITFQTLAVNSSDSNRIDAVKQVENALHWINRDAQMAWPTKIVISESTLDLQWDDTTVDPVVTHNVSYNYDSDTHVLRRADSTLTGTDTTLIAQNISDLTYTFNSLAGVLTVDISSTVEGFRSASETRTLQVKPRISR